METKKELTLSELKSAYMYAKTRRNECYKNVVTCDSKLKNALQLLSGKSETQLTNKDLLEVIKLNYEYIRAYSLYRYYRDSVDRLICKLQEIK